MSIANNSLLRRILVEVRDGSAPDHLSRPERREDASQLVELRRTSAVHTPPFATSLHFWAHSLRAFLQTQRRTELFEALAANCLCQAIPGELVRPTLEGLLARVEPPIDLSGGDFVGAYRMIEQDVLVSWVAERRGEFVALFRAQPHWIATARPLVFE